MTAVSATRQIIGIDLIRFFAASIVVLFHFCYHIWAGGPGTTTPAAAQAAIEFPELKFFRAGSVGVEIFFVISGFVIAYSAKNATAYEFFRSRVTRLMPAIWIIAPITLAVLLAVKFAPGPTLVEMFARSMVLFPEGPWIDSVYWTLPIEVIFYTVVLGLLAVDRFTYLPQVMTVVGLVSAAFWVAKWLGFDAVAMSHLSPQGENLVLRYFLVSYGCFFALGVFLWLSLLERPTLLRTLLIALFTAGCLAQINLDKNSVGACVVWLVAVLAIPLSVGLNSTLAGNPNVAYAARVLGLTTYPLYLLHDGVGAALIGYLYRSGFDRYVALGIGIIAVVSASVAIALMLEPLLKRQLGFMIDNAAETSRRILRRS